MSPAERNIRRQPGRVERKRREELLGQRGGVVWLTGLSGAGKSTLAAALEESLAGRGRASYRLDGDNLRHGLCRDLGFSVADRRENVRRVGELAALFADAGLVAICALISPFREEREGARRAAGETAFLEVFVDASLATCERRDPKGLYAKARRGELPEFTGIDSPYEPPGEADLRIDTAATGVEEAVRAIETKLVELGMIEAC